MSLHGSSPRKVFCEHLGMVKDFPLLDGLFVSQADGRRFGQDGEQARSRFQDCSASRAGAALV